MKKVRAWIRGKKGCEKVGVDKEIEKRVKVLGGRKRSVQGLSGET